MIPRRSMLPYHLAVVVAAGASVAAAHGPEATLEATESTVAAQDVAPPSARIPLGAWSRLKPGSYIRIALPNSKTVEGRLAAIRGGRLILDGPSQHAPIEGVQTVWVRSRATKKGAIAGGVIGGVAMGAFAGLMSRALCEGSCDWTPAVAAGLAVGGSGGALVGSLVGGSMPRWDRVHSDEALGASFVPSGQAASMRGRIGSASLHLGYNRALDSLAAPGATGWHLNLGTESGWLVPSIETGRYLLGASSVYTARGETLRYEESLFHVGSSLSVGPPHGPVRPYALVGLGYYNWTAFDPQVLDPRSGIEKPASQRGLLGGSLGGGIRARASGAFSLGLEGRWHRNISHVPQMAIDETTRRLSLLSVTGFVTASW